MMSPTPEDDRDLVVVRGRLRMMDNGAEHDRERRSYTAWPHLCCGCTIGIILTMFVIATTLLLASLFAFSYMSLESGTCPKEWIGLGYSCMRVAGNNATELEALDMCAQHNSKLVDFTNAKTYWLKQLSHSAPRMLPLEIYLDYGTVDLPVYYPPLEVLYRSIVQGHAALYANAPDH